VFGYPVEDAAKIAVREVREFLAAKDAKDTEEMEVIFCCFSEGDKRVYEMLLQGVK
jgi:O-acetyl-ADP-ribose deacetylase (regulator of RNase III)